MNRISRRLAIASGLAVSVIRPVSAARSDTIIKADGGRDVRVSIWPAIGRSKGVILFSHGALSAPEKYERVIGPWTQAGFEVLAPLHVDSTDHPDHAKYGMIESWRARLQDMRALSAFAGGASYVAAGHSYGGLVALTLGGAAAEVPPGIQPPLRDPRAKSVVAFSPPGVSPGLVTRAGYTTLAVPAFIETGDQDIPFGIPGGKWQVHLDSYEAAPSGDKYALVLPGVDHYFGGLICRFDRPGPTQNTQLAEAVRLSILFIEGFDAKNMKARHMLDASLTGTGPFQFSRK